MKTRENLDNFESGSDLVAPVRVNNNERAAALSVAVSELCKNVAQEDFLIAAFVLGDLCTSNSFPEESVFQVVHQGGRTALK